MPYTEADLIAVRTAMLRPEGEVEFSDRRVKYRSINELKQIEKDIITDLTAGVTTTRPKQALGVMGKGF